MAIFIKTFCISLLLILFILSKIYNPLYRFLIGLPLKLWLGEEEAKSHRSPSLPQQYHHFLNNHLSSYSSKVCQFSHPPLSISYKQTIYSPHSSSYQPVQQYLDGLHHQDCHPIYIYFLLMRKLLYYATGMALPPIEPPWLPQNSSSFHNISRRLISEIPTPAPSPLPFEEYKYKAAQMSPLVPFSDSIFDLATFCIIFALIVLSILCLAFIIQLFLKSRKLQHLQNFNSFWILRLALITFAMIWALNEVLRLPFIRRNNYLYPYLPLLTHAQQSNLCKVHVVLSFGFLQPGFFLTLLFLVNISIQKKNPHFMCAFASICALCCPLTVLHFFFVYYKPLQNIFPTFMHITSISSIDLKGSKMIFCTYPLLNCIIFSGFAISYSFAFLLTSWRVVAFVINKSIRVRINVLSFSVMISFPVQILCLGILPWFWHQDPAYSFVGLLMFLDIAICMAVGQIILVLKPIADALTAGGEGGGWTPERPQQLLDDGGWQRI